jgi:hypothetical protein
MRRYKRIKNKRNKELKIKSIRGFICLFLVLLIFIIVFVLIKISSLKKFIYVNNINSNAEITIVDPQKYKIVKILIPENTQINSSRGFGVYKISSLWKLGEKEGLSGKLVSESLRRDFLVPLYLWKDEDKTNLNLWQKIKICLLSKGFLNYDTININLIDNRVLKLKKLSDGTGGYIISSKIPESILINFVEDYMAETVSKIEIEDLTGNSETIENISKILGVMGGKITSYSKGFDKDFDCEVIGKDKILVGVVSKTFDCKVSIDTKLSVDLKIRLGGRFVDRF